ncbi:MAG: hypothetical protein MI975_15100 [Cytophagales bacterium]|nr:hypothetical protein [Cytophagales bacterium]
MMRKLNHIGIPTEKVMPDEIHMEDAKLFVTDFNESPNRIEWLRFEDGSEMPEILKTTAHIAYEVEDLNAELKNAAEIVLEPFQPNPDLTVAFVLEEGAPIELMEYKH